MTKGSDEWVRQTLLDEMKIGRRLRRKHPISQYAAFDPRVTLFGPNWQVALLPMSWDDLKGKRRQMYALARTARVTDAKAVMICADSSSVVASRICKHFGWEDLDPHDPESLKRYRERHTKVLNEQFGGYITNLPLHLWSHAVWASIKGPEIPPRTLRLEYIDNHGEIMFDPVDEAKGADAIAASELTMLPNWWEIPDDDPGVVEGRKNSEAILRKMVGL